MKDTGRSILKVTVDTNILIDFANARRTDHKTSLELLTSQKNIYFVPQDVLDELKDDEQKKTVLSWIKQNSIEVLPRPESGFVIPAVVPIITDKMSDEETIALDSFGDDEARKQAFRIKSVRDRRIGEAHRLANNNYLLTRNPNDYKYRPEIKVVSYSILNLLN